MISIIAEKDRSPSTLFEVNNDTMVKEDLRKKNVFDSSTTQMFDKKKSPKITLKNDPCILIEEVSQSVIAYFLFSKLLHVAW